MNTLESLFGDFNFALSLLGAVAVFIGFLGGVFEFLAGFGK